MQIKVGSSARVTRGGVRRVLSAGIATGVLLGSTMANAEVAIGVEAGLGASDNLTRTNPGVVEEGIATAGFDLFWEESRQRLNADMQLNLDYHDYLDDTYDSRWVGNADGLVVLAVLPERFTWHFQDSFGQAQADPFAPATPGTEENVNYATTGPDLTLRVGASSVFRVSGRYSLAEYERSPFDSERTSMGASFGRPWEQARELMFNAMRQSIDFDDQAQLDYDRDSAYVSFRRGGGRTTASLQAGYSWITRDGEEADSGALFTLSIVRSMTASSTLNLSLGTELTDSSDSLRQTVGQAARTRVSSVTASADPLTTRHADLSWAFARNRTGFSMGVSWHDDSYERQTALDRVRWAYSAQFTRRLSRTLTLTIDSSLTDDDYVSGVAEATELMAGAGIEWAFGRRFGLDFLIESFDRDTSTGAGEYRENRAFLTLFYRTAPMPR